MSASSGETGTFKTKNAALTVCPKHYVPDAWFVSIKLRRMSVRVSFSKSITPTATRDGARAAPPSFGQRTVALLNYRTLMKAPWASQKRLAFASIRLRATASPAVRVTYKLMSIQIGDILGHYRVTGVLGRGGMGKVFRVRNLVSDREEAMKVILPDLDENAELADRFLREIKVHAGLQHPNIAVLHTASRQTNEPSVYAVVQAFHRGGIRRIRAKLASIVFTMAYVQPARTSQVRIPCRRLARGQAGGAATPDDRSTALHGSKRTAPKTR
ncbi:MAG: protein kinase [Bryobacteraceae bacterium]